MPTHTLACGRALQQLDVFFAALHLPSAGEKRPSAGPAPIATRGPPSAASSRPTTPHGPRPDSARAGTLSAVLAELAAQHAAACDMQSGSPQTMQRCSTLGCRLIGALSANIAEPQAVQRPVNIRRQPCAPPCCATAVLNDLPHASSQGSAVPTGHCGAPAAAARAAPRAPRPAPSLAVTAGSSCASRRASRPSAAARSALASTACLPAQSSCSPSRLVPAGSMTRTARENTRVRSARGMALRCVPLVSDYRGRDSCAFCIADMKYAAQAPRRS